MRATDFEPGTLVEIHAGPNFKHWNGQRGIVLDPTEIRGEDPVVDSYLDARVDYGYVYVRVPGQGYGIGGWRPDHLTVLDQTIEEVEAVTGVGYFD